MAVQSGPVCEEPMMGVCFIVKSLRFVEGEEGKLEQKKEEKEKERVEEKEEEKV